MTKRLIEIREELALHLDKTADLHPVMGYTHSKAFKDGFNSACETLLPVVMELIEALSGCSDGNCRFIARRVGGMHTNGGCHCVDNAKQAITSAREKLGLE